MPIDKRVERQPGRAQLVEQRPGAHGATRLLRRRSRPTGSGIVIRPRSTSRGKLRHVARQRQHLVRRDARLGRAAVDVDLDAHLQRRQALRAAARTGAAAILSRSTRVRPVEVRGHQPRLVALDRADAMPFAARRSAQQPRSSPPLPGCSSRRTRAGPAAKASRTASGPKVLDTASSVTSSTARRGRGTGAAMRWRTCWRLSAIVVIISRATRDGMRRERGTRGYYPAAGVQRQEQGVRPAPVGRPAADDPRARRRAPHQRRARWTTSRCTPWCTTS